MKNDFIFLALALITGILIPVQAATNAAFSKSVGNASVTTLMVFIVGLIAVVVFIIASRTHLPTRQQLVSAPLYSYFGGIMVPLYVIMITILARKIGLAAAIGLIVTGQMIGAIAIDHFGFFNVALHPINLKRSIGVLLMLGGVYLVMKK